MRRILTIFLLFICSGIFGQDIKPITPLFKSLQSPSFSYHSGTLRVWIYKGSIYGWTELASQKETKFRIDSIAALYRMEEAPADHKIYGRSDSTWVEITSSSSAAIKEVFNETPIGLVNGVNIKFALDTIPVINTERLFLNGIRQQKTTDYTIALDTISFSSPPETGDLITVDYMKALPSIGVPYFNITPTGDINGINTQFTVDYSIEPPTSRIYLNGIRQYLATDYTVSGNIINFVVAPETNDIIIVDYINIP